MDRLVATLEAVLDGDVTTITRIGVLLVPILLALNYWVRSLPPTPSPPLPLTPTLSRLIIIE